MTKTGITNIRLKKIEDHMFRSLFLPKVRVCGHDSVVVCEVLEKHRPRDVHHRVRHRMRVPVPHVSARAAPGWSLDKGYFLFDIDMEGPR